jgi:hypothetical protein
MMLVGDDQQHAVNRDEYGSAVEGIMLPDLISLKLEFPDQTGIFHMTIATETFGKLSALRSVEGDIENGGGCEAD